MKGLLVMAALVAMSAGALASGCPAQLSGTLLADYRDCAGFWQCAGGAPLFHACPQGLHFSARLQRCVLPVFARCQALAGESPVHTGFMSGLLETLRHVTSSKAQPVPPVEDELSAPPVLHSEDLADEENTVLRYPDAEADVADCDTKGVEKSKENEEQKSAYEGEENELDTMEEKEQEQQEEDGKEEEQDDSERSEEKIESEEDEVDGDKEESEEKN